MTLSSSFIAGAEYARTMTEELSIAQSFFQLSGTKNWHYPSNSITNPIMTGNIDQ